VPQALRVDPLAERVTSQKSTVTTFRTSRAGAAAASGDPQESQKLAPARFSDPQLVQTVIRRV
jgi:hypothetical protein